MPTQIRVFNFHEEIQPELCKQLNIKESEFRNAPIKGEVNRETLYKCQGMNNRDDPDNATVDWWIILVNHVWSDNMTNDYYQHHCIESQDYIDHELSIENLKEFMNRLTDEYGEWVLEIYSAYNNAVRNVAKKTNKKLEDPNEDEEILIYISW